MALLKNYKTVHRSDVTSLQTRINTRNVNVETVLTYLCGLLSQLETDSCSVYCVLLGTSLVMLPAALGASDTPVRLYRRPEPSGSAKNTVPYKRVKNKQMYCFAA